MEVGACSPVGSRFEGTWETVDGARGEVARQFGTLMWNRSRLSYEIAAGYVVEVCLASVDAEAGFTFGAAGTRLRGPAAGSLPFDDITEIGFGSDEAPTAVGTGLLPQTGTEVSLGLAAAASAAVVAGWWMLRTRCSCAAGTRRGADP